MTLPTQVANHITPVPEWMGFVQSALQEVFNMMLGVQVTPAQAQSFRYEVTSMVGLAGNHPTQQSIRSSSSGFFDMGIPGYDQATGMGAPRGLSGL